MRWKSNKSNFLSSLLELPISANTLLIFEAINLQIYGMLQKTWKQAFSLKGTEKLSHQNSKSDLFSKVNRADGRNQEGLLFFLPT